MSNRYINVSASGANNGTSWADAYSSLSSVPWTRGDTYYIAGGTYPTTADIGTAVSGTTWITLKKANAADNSGDAGWNASYASDVALIIGRFNISVNYVEIDGVTGSGVVGHGIKLYDYMTQGLGTLRAPGGPYRLYHVEVRGGAHKTPRGINGIHGGSPGTNVHIAYCWIHSTSMNGATFGTVTGTSFSDYGILFENNVVSETGGAVNGDHGQGIQIQSGSGTSYHIFRNNVFRNVSGTAFIAYLLSANYTDVRVYNNVFYKDDITSYPTISPGTIYTRDTTTSSNFLIANNTFYGLGDASNTGTLAGVFLDGTESGHVLQNNVWENSRFSTGGNVGIDTTSTNGYYNNNGVGVPSGTTGQVDGGATTFEDGAAGDFRIASGGYAEGAGLDLSSTFTTDLYGTTRTGWNLGAIESNTAPDTVPLEAVASINQTGAEFWLDLTTPCTAGAGGTGGITLSSTGAAITATYSAGDGTTFWRYTLSRTVESWEVLTWSYSTANGIETTLDGTDLAAVSGGAVRNYTFPAVVSRVIPSGGTTFEVTFSQPVKFGTGSSAGTITASGGAVTGTYLSGVGTTTLTWTLSRTIASDETLSWSYTATNGIEDNVTGNDVITAANLTGAITNNSGEEPAPEAVLTAGNAPTASRPLFR